MPSKGYIPRDLTKRPLYAHPSEKPFSITPIPRDEWKDRSEHMIEKNLDPLGQCILHDAMPTYQDGIPSCWANAGIMSVKAFMASQGQAVPRLCATGPAAKIMNFRQRGGNASDIYPFLSEHGAPTVDLWPENSFDRQYDNPETWQAAKAHMVLETEPIERGDVLEQVMSAVLSGFPVWSGYSDLGHAMCKARVRWTGSAAESLDINSWHKGAAEATTWDLSWLSNKNVCYPRNGRKFSGFEHQVVRSVTVVIAA